MMSFLAKNMFFAGVQSSFHNWDVLQFSFFIHVFSYCLPSLFTVLGALLKLLPLTSFLSLVHTLFFYDPSNPHDDIPTDVMFTNIL